MHFALLSDSTSSMVPLEELQQLFPSIPLVAEEDSAFIRSSNTADSKSNTLVESISSFFTKHVNNNGPPLTHDDVLRAIDRGGKDAVSFDSNPATYWVSYESFINHTSRSAKVSSSE